MSSQQPTSSQRTELVIIRHGETVWNQQIRLQGFKDSPLTEQGLAQAHALAEELTRRPFDALYSSDLARALRVAEIIAERTGQPVQTDPRLRERNLGVAGGLTMTEFQARYPREYVAFRSGDIDHVITEGESLRQMYDRAFRACDDIAQAHPGQRVVIVTHGYVLAGLFRHATGLPLDLPRNYSLFNSSLNVFGVRAGKWRLETWGDIHHLGPLDTMDDQW